MVTSLLKYDRIQTTDAKAKELRRWADHIITLAKRGDLHARRQAMSIVREKAVVHKVFEEAPKRFATVSGGYTRIIKIGRRPGDAAPVSLIELVTPEPKKKKTPKKTKAATPKKAAPKKKAVKKDAAADQKTVVTQTSKVEAGSTETTEETSTGLEEKTVSTAAPGKKKVSKTNVSNKKKTAEEDTEKKE
jgi:large subunit ribosomal protein L17